MARKNGLPWGALVLALPLVAVVMPGCVPVPPDMMNQVDMQGVSTAAVQASFVGLDAGGADAQSLHFIVTAYGKDKAGQIADQTEQDYSRILQDTGLYSYLTGVQYKIVVYLNADEYHRKTSLPDWSVATANQGTIYTYEGAAMRPALAHQLTHLTLNNFFVSSHPELRWISEGMALYEEYESLPQDLQSAWDGKMDAVKRANYTLAQLVQSAPLDEKRDDVNPWYPEAASVTKYLVENGGRLGFLQFLTALKSGSTPDQAIASGFPGRWGSLSALETAWRQS